MLPCVYVKHPAVTQYLVSGADLMLPGVHIPPEGLPPFNKDDLVAVSHFLLTHAHTYRLRMCMRTPIAYCSLLVQTEAQLLLPFMRCGFLAMCV